MVKFNDLKPGHTFYFLIKGAELKLEEGKVVNVSQPYFPTQTPIGQVPNYSNRILDVTVKSGEVTKTYTVSENSFVSETPDGTIISADKEGITREVEAIQNNVKEALEKVEQHKLYLKCCDEILASLNPAIAERKEQDKRIANLEQGFGDMRTILQDISQTLKNLQK